MSDSNHSEFTITSGRHHEIANPYNSYILRSDLPSDGATVLRSDTLELMTHRGVRGRAACAPVD